jgi:hypothetical protein
MIQPRYSVTVQLNPAEFEALNALVHLHGTNRSNLIKGLILQAAEQQRPPRVPIPG